MGCESSIRHEHENYCDKCSTCHDCLEEGRQRDSELIKKMKAALWDSYYNEACLNRAIHSKAKEYADTRIKAYK